MKKLCSKKAFWQSLFSVIVLGIFILLAVGSVLDNWAKYEVQYLGNGMYREKDYLNNGQKTYTGSRDEKGRWHGQIESTMSYKDEALYRVTTEKYMMLHGARHGECITTVYYGTSVVTYQDFYYMGHKLTPDNKKTAHDLMADISAFQVLGNKYPWFLYSLNVYGFDNAFVESYMNTFETKLSAYAYDATKFDDYYGDVTDELEETPYDSIITLNSKFTTFQGIEAAKNSEFRLAVIDRYLLSGSSIFNIVSTTYPCYLQTMSTKGVNNEDFKAFCQDMDSRMISYGALNMQDPFYIDSLDARMFRAIVDIYNTSKSFSLFSEPSVNSMLLNYKNYDINDIYDEVKQMLNSSFSKSTPIEVALIVANDMMWQYFIQSDLIYQTVKEAYYIKGGVKRVPIATTVFEGTSSSTSVSLKGYVIEDGGAAVTSRGIAWATYYNPTINDNKVAQGTGTGSFPAVITGLTYGTTYYARTYATNSAGTAYGNCISFNTNITTAINDIKPSFTHDFSIYPNPASSSVTLNFKLETQGKIRLIVFDMKGKVIMNKDLGNLSPGENQILFDISGLQNGMYICQLMKGTAKVNQRLVISH